MNCSLTGKITFTSLSKLKTSTSRTVMNFNRFSKKINGKNVSINEKAPFSHLFSIGVTTLNRLPSIPKTLSGNISQATIASCTPFWSKWKTPISWISPIASTRPSPHSSTIKNF
jgi:hypothetical protein